MRIIWWHCTWGSELARGCVTSLKLYSDSGQLRAAAAAKSLQLCLTLCDPIDGSPPGSTIPGILQARTLEWVAISFSNASKWKVKVKTLSHAWLLVTPWTSAYQAPPSMGFSRQEYWSGFPLPSPQLWANHKILLVYRKWIWGQEIELITRVSFCLFLISFNFY